MAWRAGPGRRWEFDVHRSAVILVASLLITGCDRGGDATAAPATEARDPIPRPVPAAQSEPPARAQAPVGAGWDLQASGEGTALVLPSRSGAAAIRLFCPAARSELLVNVPAFRPIGSEERLSFGSGGEVVALVADVGGDAARGGVSATGAVPRNLAALIAGPVAASYGAQTSGPHPPPPARVAQPFAAACYKRLSVPPAAPIGEPPAATVPVHPCLRQGETALSVAPFRAVGTEPFWAARVEGRCVTYSDPDDQLGTRVWTRYTPGPDGGGTWSGALDGQPFLLRTRPEPGCSDGMSDRRYPLVVDLLVKGERRRGCAAPP